jgi:hypothetical protein
LLNYNLDTFRPVRFVDDYLMPTTQPNMVGAAGVY